MTCRPRIEYACWLVITIGAVLVACSPKAGEVVEKHKASSAELRGKLQAVHAATGGALTATCSPPAELLHGTSFDVVHREMLIDPYADIKRAGRAIDLLLSQALSLCLVWTGDKSPLHPDVDGSNVEQTLKTCEAMPYVLVASETSHDRSKAELVMKYDLVAIETANVLCSFAVTSVGKADLGTVNYKVVEENQRTGERRDVRHDSRDEYSSYLWTMARKDLAAAVKTKLSIELEL